MRLQTGGAPITKGYEEMLHPRGWHGHWIHGTHAEQRAGRSPIHVKSSIFGGPHVGEFQSFNDAGTHATVRLELPDDHPAVRDTLADNPDMPLEHMEFIDRVPVSQLEIHGEDPRKLGQLHAGELAARAQAERMRGMVAESRARQAAAKPDPNSPHRKILDSGLRTRQH